MKRLRDLATEDRLKEGVLLRTRRCRRRCLPPQGTGSTPYHKVRRRPHRARIGRRAVPNRSTKYWMLALRGIPGTDSSPGMLQRYWHIQMSQTLAIRQHYRCREAAIEPAHPLAMPQPQPPRLLDRHPGRARQELLVARWESASPRLSDDEPSHPPPMSESRYVVQKEVRLVPLLWSPCRYSQVCRK